MLGLETLLGGVVGGIFRVVPEVLKFMDRKNERKHELSMQDKAFEFQKLQGDQKIDEISTKGQMDWNTGALDALAESIKGQSAPSGVKWIDGFSKMMRPLITLQWVVLLYPAVIVAGFWLSVTSGISALDALVKCFGPPEKALVSGILNFWFLGRVFDKVDMRIK
uniref:Holin n=2 Tax=viral metagenome TaxID=1070528 RepID=A0A6M3KJB1_9ZZZZ